DLFWRGTSMVRVASDCFRVPDCHRDAPGSSWVHRLAARRDSAQVPLEPHRRSVRELAAVDAHDTTLDGRSRRWARMVGARPFGSSGCLQRYNMDLAGLGGNWRALSHLRYSV